MRILKNNPALLAIVLLSLAVLLHSPAFADSDDKTIKVDYGRLGKTLYWESRYEEAFNAFVTAIKRQPTNAEHQYMAGLSLLKAGKAAKSIGYFERAIAIYTERKIEYDKGLLNSRLNIARAYNELGKYDKVEELFRELAAAYPRNTDIYNILGSSHMNRKDYGRAIEIFNDALKIYPPNGYTFNNLGMCYLHQGNIEAANAYFARAVDLIPFGAAFLYNNLALTFELLDNQAKAAELYRKALSIDPNNANAREALARFGR